MLWFLLALCLAIAPARAQDDTTQSEDSSHPSREAVLAGLRDRNHPEQGPWKDRSLDPWATTDITAYTIPKKHFRIGLFNQDYGLLKNTQVGIVLPLWLIRVPNAHGKVTAIQTPRFDAAFDAGWYGYNLEKAEGFQIPGGYLVVLPLGWRASWLFERHLSLHFGTAWVMANVRARLTARQLGNLLDQAFGMDIADEVVRVMGSQSAIYAGANLTLTRLRLAMDYRINRRDSIIFAFGSYLTARGLVAAGYETNAGETTTAEIGPSARIRMPIYQQLPSTFTVSYQLTWPHWQLRLGLPLASTTVGVVLGMPQALTLAAIF